MSFSPTSYSRRAADPLVVAWKAAVVAAGSSADGATLRALDNAAYTARTQNLLLTSGTGLVRLNLFCGSSLAGAMVPLVRELGAAADTNNNFVAADFAERGPAAGLNSNGTTKSLSTGLTPSSVDDWGGNGVWFSEPWTVPTADSSLMGVRTGNNFIRLRAVDVTGTKLQHMWGATGVVVQIAKVTAPVGLLYGFRQSFPSQGIWHSDGTLQLQTANDEKPVSTASLHIFANNHEGTGVVQHSAARLGGYFVWKGPITDTQRGWLETMFEEFNATMGRRTA